MAHPATDDENFARSVVLLIAHSDHEGSMGVIINRPGPRSGPENGILAPWLDCAAGPHVVFHGGPVEPDGFVCLVQDAEHPSGVRSVDFMHTDPAPLSVHRLFRGYAGWAPGQLATEIAVGGWIVVTALPEDPFDPEPSSLWRRILLRQGGPIAALSRVPADPSLN